MPGKDNKIYYCPDCGKKLIGRVNKNGEPRWKRCFACSRKAMDVSMEHNSHWKGGRIKDDKGYIRVMLAKNSPYISMANGVGYVAEHRLVMAIKLGRCLLRSELVHHINGIRDDNRPENLEILSRGNHSLRTMYCDKCELKKEIRLLRWQMKEQSEQIRLLTSKLMGV